MISASTTNGSVTLGYDPLGRLWQVTGANTGTTRFLYDGEHVVGEYNAAGAILRRYYWGPGADEPILQDEGGAMNCQGTRFLHPDERGSIVGIADCSGNRLQTNTYSEFGVPAASNWGRFRYTGQAWIQELGMYYYKARMYSPMLGRFMQTDPIGYTDGLNWYNYVGSDPINNTDPSGLVTICPPNGFPRSPSFGIGDSAKSDIVVTGRCTPMPAPNPAQTAPPSPPPGNPGQGIPSQPQPQPQNVCPAVPAARPVGTRGEWGAGLRDPSGGYAAHVAADQARAASAAAYPDLPSDGTVRDAYRHFYWVSAMTRVLGPARAMAFANSHEANYPLQSVKDVQSRRMDTFNNYVAVQMTLDRRSRGLTTAQLTNKAIASGCLRVLK